MDEPHKEETLNTMFNVCVKLSRLFPAQCLCDIMFVKKPIPLPRIPHKGISNVHVIFVAKKSIHSCYFTHSADEDIRTEMDVLLFFMVT